MRHAQEERIKLFASYFNTIAAGMIVTGIVAPSTALVVNSSLSADSILYLVVVAFLISLLLHTVAQAALGTLTDDES